MIPPMATDTNAENPGAFPGGEVRFRNVGLSEGLPFDLVVTVPDDPLEFPPTFPIEYISPYSPTSTQASMTSGGFACLGFGVRPATCPEGSSLDLVSAECTDRCVDEEGESVCYSSPTTWRGEHS